MKAAVFYGKNDIRVEEVDIPSIDNDEVLIKVRACALCGTDLRIYQHGHFKIPTGTKRILGHETAGEIVKVGRNIKGYPVGTRVVVLPNIGCGNCKECINGLSQLCSDYEAFGISMDGGFQEYLRIPQIAITAGALVRIPDQLSFEEAALVEPFSCCYNSYTALKTRPGDTALIIGAGPIGSMHIMMNKLAGATKIIVVDVNQARLNKAKELGADVVINPNDIDLFDMIKKETDNKGADIVIVACSVPEMQISSLELAAKSGRVNFFGGLPNTIKEVLLNTNLIHYKQLTILGTTGSSISDFYKALHIIASGKVDLKKLISTRFTLTQTNDAFNYAASGEGMKVFLIND